MNADKLITIGTFLATVGKVLVLTVFCGCWLALGALIFAAVVL